MALNTLQPSSAVDASFAQLHAEGSPARDIAMGAPPPAPVSNRKGTIGHLVNTVLPGLVAQATAAGVRGDSDKANQILGQIGLHVDSNYDALTRAAAYRGQDVTQQAVAGAANTFLRGDYMNNPEDPAKSLYVLADPESDNAKRYRAAQQRSGTHLAAVARIENGTDEFAKSMMYADGFGAYASPDTLNEAANMAPDKQMARMNRLMELDELSGRAQTNGGETQAYYQALDYLKSAYGSDKLSAAAERERLLSTMEKMVGGGLTRENIGTALQDMRSLHANFYRDQAGGPNSIEAAKQGRTTQGGYSINSIYAHGASTREDDLYTTALSTAESLYKILNKPADDPISRREFYNVAMSSDFRELLTKATNSGWLARMDESTKQGLLTDMLHNFIAQRHSGLVPAPDRDSMLLRGMETSDFTQKFFDTLEGAQTDADGNKILDFNQSTFSTTMTAVSDAVEQILPTFFNTGVSGNSNEMLFAALTDKDTVNSVVAAVRRTTGQDEDFIRAVITESSRQLMESPTGRIDLNLMREALGSTNTGKGDSLSRSLEGRNRFEKAWEDEKAGKTPDALRNAIATTYELDGLPADAKVFNADGTLSEKSLTEAAVELEQGNRHLMGLSDHSFQTKGVASQLLRRFGDTRKAHLGNIKEPDVDEFDEEAKKKAQKEHDANTATAEENAFMDALGLLATGGANQTEDISFFNPANPGQKYSVGELYKQMKVRADAGDETARSAVAYLVTGMQSGNLEMVESGLGLMMGAVAATRTPKEDPESAKAALKCLNSAKNLDLSMFANLAPNRLPPQELKQLFADYAAAEEELAGVGGSRCSYADVTSVKTGRGKAWITFLSEYARVNPSKAADLYEKTCNLAQLDHAKERVNLFRTSAQGVKFAQLLAEANEKTNDEWEERNDNAANSVMEMVGYLNYIGGGIGTGVGIGTLKMGIASGITNAGLSAGLGEYTTYSQLFRNEQGAGELADLTNTMYGKSADPITQALQNINLGVDVRGERNRIRQENEDDPWLRRAFGSAAASAGVGYGIGKSVGKGAGGLIGAAIGGLVGFGSSLVRTAYNQFWFDDPTMKNLTSAVDSAIRDLPAALGDSPDGQVVADQIRIGLEDISKDVQAGKLKDPQAIFTRKVNVWRRGYAATLNFASRALGENAEKVLENDGVTSTWIRGGMTGQELRKHLDDIKLSSTRGLARDEDQAKRWRAAMSRMDSQADTRRFNQVRRVSKEASKKLSASEGNQRLLLDAEAKTIACVKEMEENSGANLSEAEYYDIYSKILVHNIQEVAQAAQAAKFQEIEYKAATKHKYDALTAQIKNGYQMEQLIARQEESRARAAQAQAYRLQSQQYGAALKEDPNAPIPGTQPNDPTAVPGVEQ